MNVTEFDYHLPSALIAQTPIEPRDASRMMYLNRSNQEIEHYSFRDIARIIRPGDVLVVNHSKVLPARLLGVKKETGAKIEILLLKRMSQTCWEVLVKPGKRLKMNQEVDFGDGLLVGRLKEVMENGNRAIEFFYEGVFEELLDSLGKMPLPPYITRELTDQGRYQTIYAKEEGSAAAPTAGLHFTKELISKLQNNGIEVLEILLHVGLGTFRPVKTERIEEHQMHSEYFSMDEHTAKRINLAKEEGRRVIAVGTTVVRTLETAAGLRSGHPLEACEGWTDIFIYPGYQFKIINALITNFHFPQTTLLMLVSAFAGKEFVLKAYETAIREHYRFFSFGDCMFIE